MSGVIACVNGNLHHNNIYMFRNDLPSYDANNMCAVYLTASTLCATNNSSHFDVDGVTWPNSMACIVRDPDYDYSHDDDNPYAYSRMVMVHEIGHLFNVEDHYSNYATANSEPDCIWGDNAYNYRIAKTCSTCSTCHNTIVNNRNLYHHTS